MRVLLPARSIPVGADVTKRAGVVIYKLTNVVHVPKIIAESGRIEALGDARFLVRDNHVDAIDGATELLWIVEPGELRDWLETQLGGAPQ